MSLATELLVVITLVLCGGYAGMVLMCQIGVLPAMRDVDPGSFVAAWRAMDSYMGRLMPPYKAALLVSTLVTVTVLAVQHRLRLASCFGASFVLSIIGLVQTVRGQLPLNAEIKVPTLPEHRIIEIREQTSAGFRVRCWLAALSFVFLCVGVTFWPAT